MLTHLNAVDNQTAFAEVFTLDDEQRSAFDQQHLAVAYPLNSFGSSKYVLNFSPALVLQKPMHT